jgi:uroporphyrin-III C-methyltransferase/precorrin-2 dehydrogenase/sirohydrochlorin ferrochelatase
VVQQGTRTGERVLRATLADVAEQIREQGIKPPAIIVIGPVAGLQALKSS